MGPCSCWALGRHASRHGPGTALNSYMTQHIDQASLNALLNVFVNLVWKWDQISFSKKRRPNHTPTRWSNTFKKKQYRNVNFIDSVVCWDYVTQKKTTITMINHLKNGQLISTRLDRSLSQLCKRERKQDKLNLFAHPAKKKNVYAVAVASDGHLTSDIPKWWDFMLVRCCLDI